MNKNINTYSERLQLLNLTNILIISISLFASLDFFILRLGFNDNNFFDIIKVFSLSIVILLLPDLIYLKIGFKTKAWYKTLSFLSLIVFFMTGLFSYALHLLNIEFSFFIVIIGLLTILFYTNNAIKLGFKINIKYIIIFLLFSFFTFSCLNNSLYIEKIILGTAHVDSIFFDAISSMISTYNVPSTGLDGIPYLNYHWLTYWFYSNFASISNLSSYKFSSIAYLTLWIPFLIKSFLLFFVELLKVYKIDLKSYILPFIILFFFIIGINSGIATNNSALKTLIILHSPSYTLGLSFSFFMITIFIDFFRNTKIHQRKIAFIYLFIPLMFLVLSFTKISSAFLVIVLYIYFCFRNRYWKKFCFSVIISTFIFVLSFLLFGRGGETRIELFHFIKHHIPSKLYFLFFYYLNTIIAVVLLLLNKQITSFKGLFLAIKKNKIIEIELLILISVAGFIPGLLIDLTGRNALYFMDLQRWLSLFIIMALSPYYIKKIKSSLTKNKLKYPIYAISSVVILLISINVFINYRNRIKGHLIDNFYVRNELIKSSENKQVKSIKSYIYKFNEHYKLAQNAKVKTKEYKVLSILKELNDLQISVKKNSCIYIPKSNITYWNILKYKTNGIPFVAPALSGICMINGLPEKLHSGFGYYQYKNKTKSNKKNLSDNEILERAKSKGFSNVYIIESINNRQILRKITSSKK